MQIVGLMIVVVQVAVAAGTSTRPDRPWVLLVAVAMMIGGFGMELLLRAALRIVGKSA